MCSWTAAQGTDERTSERRELRLGSIQSITPLLWKGDREKQAMGHQTMSSDAGTVSGMYKSLEGQGNDNNGSFVQDTDVRRLGYGV